MFSIGRRDTTEVVYEVLTLAQAGVSRNQLVQHANLNFQLATRYVSLLTNRGLIRKRDLDGVTGKYELTRKGERVLMLLSELEDEVIGLDHESTKRNIHTANPFQMVDIRPETSNPGGAKRGLEKKYPNSNLLSLLAHLAGFLAGLGLGYVLP